MLLGRLCVLTFVRDRVQIVSLWTPPLLLMQQTMGLSLDVDVLIRCSCSSGGDDAVVRGKYMSVMGVEECLTGNASCSAVDLSEASGYYE